MPARIYDALKFLAIQALAVLDAAWRRLLPDRLQEPVIRTGGVTPGSRSILCVFAHFDRDGLVDDYVVHYLSALSGLGCEIVFVSAAPGFAEASARRVSPYCTKIVARQNRGYDFGSWRDGLACVEDPASYERLILANDSVYGPVRDLAGVFRAMDKRGVPVWGITDSLRYGRHLQSYFLVFERPVLQSEAFRNFWRALPDHRLKHVVILRGEVALSRRLHRAGFELAALCEYELLEDAVAQEVAQGTGRTFPGAPVNSTHWAWRALIRDHGCPFVKVQLLRDNPKRIADVSLWERTIREHGDYDTTLIRRHLERMAGTDDDDDVRRRVPGARSGRGGVVR